MWVFEESGLCKWDVGYFDPNGKWKCIIVTNSFEEAYNHVCKLNGGN